MTNTSQQFSDPIEIATLHLSAKGKDNQEEIKTSYTARERGGMQHLGTQGCNILEHKSKRKLGVHCCEPCTHIFNILLQLTS